MLSHVKPLLRSVLPSPVKDTISALRSLPQCRLDDLPQWLRDRVPDRFVQASQFTQTFGRTLNLAAPKTFNEKLHWLSLYYRIPEIRELTDKYAARAHVAARCGDRVLNELFGVWDDPWELPFEELPDAFVLKVTSGSGQTSSVATGRGSTSRVRGASWQNG